MNTNLNEVNGQSGFRFELFLDSNKDDMELVASNIADSVVNFESHYKTYEGETLDDYMGEFSVVWLEGDKSKTEEYVVAFGNEVLFGGFNSEEDAEQVYNWLNERAYQIAEG